MYISKPFIWTNIAAIGINALLWLLVFLRAFPGLLAFLVLLASIAGCILVSAKANGRSVLPQPPFHEAPTEKVRRIPR